MSSGLAKPGAPPHDAEVARARALERAMAQLAFGKELDPNNPAQVSAWLTRAGVAAEDRAELLARGVGRLMIYRQLVRGNIEGAIELAIPRTLQRMGAEVFEEYLSAWLAAEGPQTHYLRDVTREFLNFSLAAWNRDPRLAPYVMELARHESMRIELASERALPAAQEPGELELDRGVQFIEAVRLVRYQHAIHRLSEDEADTKPPEPTPTALLAYRSPSHEVRYLELTPLAASILERLLGGQTLQQALVGGCADLGVELTQAVLEGSARVLADLAERGALVGSREAAEPVQTEGENTSLADQ